MAARRLFQAFTGLSTSGYRREGPRLDLFLPRDEVARRILRSLSNRVLEIINQWGFVKVITLNKEGAEWGQLNST